ncbi:MAG: pitrilysin family protein [Acidobacteriota bacterium]
MSVDRTRLPVPGPQPPFRFPAIARRASANGVDLRAVRHEGVSLTTAALVLRGGFAADPAARVGITSFTADLLDEGVDGLDALGVADAVARLGGDLDIDVGPDAILLQLTTLERHFREGLDLLLALVTRPRLAEADVERLRQLRLDRLRQLKDHAPALAERAFARAIYQDHPYGHLPLGVEAAIKATTAADIRAHHAALATPGRATLVVSGGQAVEALLDQAAAAVSAWTPPPNDTQLPDGQAPPPAAPLARLVVVPRDGAAQTEIRIGHVAAARATPDYHALVLLNMVLGGQFVSRINLNLREQKGYTYGVRTGFDFRRGRGPFVLQTSVQTEVTVPAVREAIREIVEIRGARPVTGDELALARASLTLGYPRGFETLQQVARAAAQLALHDLADDYFEQFVPRVEAVTAEDVARVAEAHLDPDRLAVVLVGDVSKMEAALPELGLGEPQVVAP